MMTGTVYIIQADGELENLERVEGHTQAQEVSAQQYQQQIKQILRDILIEGKYTSTNAYKGKVSHVSK